MTPPRTVRTAPGAAAAAALAAEVVRAKAGDPFAPVRLVVRAEDAAVHVRRAVARAAGGVAALDALPLDRLARTVLDAAGGPDGAGVRRAPRPVLAAALRRAARRGDRVLADAADQPATQDALVATYHELTALGSAGLDDAGRRPGLAGSVARLVVEARRALAAGGWLDDAALAERAAATAATARPTPVVVLRTEPPSPVEAALLGALAAVGPLAVVEAVEDAPTPRHLTLRPATDPDEEARAAVRTVAEAVAAGVPADRIALAFTADQPYRRIVAEHLAEAGLEWNGSAAGSLLESPAGRVALAELASPAGDGPHPWRRLAEGVARAVGEHAPDDAATAAVLRLTAQLPPLDAWGPPPAAAVAVETVRSELAAVLPRVGAVGRGVTVGTLRRVLDGAPWDLVVVVGAAEGWAPSGSAGASLLGDADRRALGLPTAADQDERQRARLLGVVGGAGRAVVSWPVADLRRTSRRTASRWLAPLAEATAAAGVPVEHHGLVTAYGAVATRPSPLAGDRRRRRALAEPDALAADDAVFASGLAALRARTAPSPTAFDGDLRGEDLEPLRLAGPVAPTMLERFATCGRVYFTTAVLGVREARLLDELTGPDPASEGGAVHRVLERAVADEEALGRPLTRAEQAAVVGEVLDADPVLQAVPELLRRQLRRVHLARLWRALDADAEDRAARRRPVAAELRFGGDDGFAIELPDGRRLALRGSIDRVDRLPDGRLVVVDYKTGRSVRRGAPEDPLLGGRTLQLAVYAAAAGARLGAPVATVEYRLVGRDAVRRFPSPADAHVDALAPTLAALVADVEAGRFLPGAHGARQPGRPTCWVCDPHGLLARQQARRARTLAAGSGRAADAEDDADA